MTKQKKMKTYSRLRTAMLKQRKEKKRKESMHFFDPRVYSKIVFLITEGLLCHRKEFEALQIEDVLSSSNESFVNKQQVTDLRIIGNDYWRHTITKVIDTRNRTELRSGILLFGKRAFHHVNTCMNQSSTIEFLYNVLQ